MCIRDRTDRERQRETETQTDRQIDREEEEEEEKMVHGRRRRLRFSPRRLKTPHYLNSIDIKPCGMIHALNGWYRSLIASRHASPANLAIQSTAAATLTAQGQKM